MAARATVVVCQGAPRTCRCIETLLLVLLVGVVLRQGAPRTCRCIETDAPPDPDVGRDEVREHHAPVGALRLETPKGLLPPPLGVREHHAPVGALRHRARFPLSQYYRVREYYAPDEVDVQLVAVVSGSTTQL